MSNLAMNCAWTAADAPTDPGPMFVLVVLADHASDHDGEDFRAFPSVERIVKFTKFSRSAVERHLQTLVRLGWISRRRRVRNDGKKGVYDYELHRDIDRRATLRAAREAMIAAGEKPSGEARDAEWNGTLIDAPQASEPCSELQHGPCVKLSETMRQFGAEPCGKSPHHEPLVEPLVEPSLSGRASAEARDVDANGVREIVTAVWAAWPDFGRLTSSRKLLRHAVEAELASGADPAALIAAAAAYAADKSAWGASGKPKAVHGFYAEGRWENFTNRGVGASAGLGGGGAATAWAGPGEVFAAAAAVLGGGVATSCLAKAGWRAEGGVILARTDYAAKRLNNRECREALQSVGVGGVILERAAA